MCGKISRSPGVAKIAFPQKYGVGSYESSPLLLTEGGPGGAGCGGDPVRFVGLPGTTIGPTSVSPDGLPPSPQGEGFSLKPSVPTS